MYHVKLKEKDVYSMCSFVMWTPQVECAKLYTLEGANKLIAEIPAHMGIGELVEVGCKK